MGILCEIDAVVLSELYRENKNLVLKNCELNNKVHSLEKKLLAFSYCEILSKKDFQDYCAYKHIEPQIRGCLDRERVLLSKINNLKEKVDMFSKMNYSNDYERGFSRAFEMVKNFFEELVL